MKKITDKVKYDDVQVEAQGCADDCEYIRYYNKNAPTTPIVGGSAITAPCICSEIKEEYKPADSNKWPLW